ncbi:MAG: hypothetical protein IJI74_05300 [Firmicutes bacterium]|nr:hypothetical protein [Bacillota bacterium]
MIITRRSDYAIRICRALKDGKIHNVREICETEDIPKPLHIRSSARWR